MVKMQFFYQKINLFLKHESRIFFSSHNSEFYMSSYIANFLILFLDSWIFTIFDLIGCFIAPAYFGISIKSDEKLIQTTSVLWEVLLFTLQSLCQIKLNSIKMKMIICLAALIAVALCMSRIVCLNCSSY